MAQGSALTRNDIPHGSKNWLQRAILYRHKRYKCVREDCRQYQGETIYIFAMVIWWNLWINVFVWAGVLCGTRIHQFASMDCSGVIQKIHMGKIRRQQGQSTWWKFVIFHAQRTLDEDKWTSHGPGVCADAQCDTVHGSKNLFQRAILYRHKKIYQWQGRLQAISGRKYIWFVVGFHQYLRIGQFVWAGVLCGTRYYQCASMDCSGII